MNILAYRMVKGEVNRIDSHDLFYLSPFAIRLFLHLAKAAGFSFGHVHHDHDYEQRGHDQDPHYV